MAPCPCIHALVWLIWLILTTGYPELQYVNWVTFPKSFVFNMNVNATCLFATTLKRWTKTLFDSDVPDVLSFLNGPFFISIVIFAIVGQPSTFLSNTIISTLPKTNVAPYNGGYSNWNFLFQGAIFKGYVSFREGTSSLWAPVRCQIVCCVILVV